MTTGFSPRPLNILFRDTLNDFQLIRPDSRHPQLSQALTIVFTHVRDRLCHWRKAVGLENIDDYDQLRAALPWYPISSDIHSRVWRIRETVQQSNILIQARYARFQAKDIESMADSLAGLSVAAEDNLDALAMGALKIRRTHHHHVPGLAQQLLDILRQLKELERDYLPDQGRGLEFVSEDGGGPEAALNRALS